MAATRLAAALAAAGALLAPAAAAATGGAGVPDILRSKALWATINVCDTPAHPHTIGIRASMPGDGVRSERMFMRFQVQYFDPATRKWSDMGPDADSGFLPVGSARFRARQSGRNFAIAPPAADRLYRLRGSVAFQWRSHGKVVRRAHRLTAAGHPGTVGSDPKGFTAAECTIRP